MDSLDSLLKEALDAELRNRRGKGTITRLNAIKEICHATWTNPANWRSTGFVRVIHDSGAEIGLFQEFKHTKYSALQLKRAPEGAVGDLSAVDVLHVEGPQWLGPFQHVVD